MARSVRILVVVAALVSSVTIVPHADAALPAPSWWNGACDANHWNPAASSLGWHGAGAHALGASYLGVAVCGPRPSVDGAPDVRWSKSGWGEFEWECVELTMRFMSLAYGVSAYNANGNNVVRNYTTSAGGGLVRINNGTTGKAPLPGDVVSFDNASDPPGHAGVVASSNVDSSGNGTVTLLSQNDTSDGWRTLAVRSWRLASFGSFVPYGWLHDPAAGGGGGDTNHPPFGAINSAKGEAGHHVHVRGWTIDPDTPKKSTKVIMYVAGKQPKPFRVTVMDTADASRTDVAQQHPAAGRFHGFDLTTAVPRAQRVHVDVVAVDTTDGSRTVVGSRFVTVP